MIFVFPQRRGVCLSRIVRIISQNLFAYLHMKFQRHWKVKQWSGSMSTMFLALQYVDGLEAETLN